MHAAARQHLETSLAAAWNRRFPRRLFEVSLQPLRLPHVHTQSRRPPDLTAALSRCCVRPTPPPPRRKAGELLHASKAAWTSRLHRRRLEVRRVRLHRAHPVAAGLRKLPVLEAAATQFPGRPLDSAKQIRFAAGRSRSPTHQAQLLMLRRLLTGVSSPPASLPRRAFRSDASLEAIRSHSSSEGQVGPAHLALYNCPTFAGAYAALAAHLFHRRLCRRLLILPFYSVEPFRAVDFKAAGFQTCYLLDFIGPKKFALELAQFVPSVVAFDHRQSTLVRIPQLGQCPSNLELRIDTTKSSARAVFDYFSKKLAGTKSDSDMCENLLDQEDEERVTNVLKYVEDADLRQWQLPNTKEFHTALRDERAKLNCVTNPHVFKQLLQLDVSNLLARGKSFAHGRLEAAGKLIQKPFKIQLGRGSFGECLAIRADGNSELSHEICLELSKWSAAAGLRPIGAVVFMQRGILKICLRTTDSTTNTAEIAKAYGGGGKPSSSSFALRMDEFNAWTSVNS